MSDNHDILRSLCGLGGDWRRNMAVIVETMREMSLQTDAQAMVRAYGARLRQFMPVDRWVSLSRRDLESPRVRVTRSSTWTREVNPWRQKDLLPVLSGGLMAELIYGDEPRLINDLRVPPEDPGAEFFDGMRSLIAVPHYDGGVGLNMVLSMRRAPDAFDPESFPAWVWISSLFGRATHNLVLSEDLRRTNEILERELRVVAEIQRSLLPKRPPRIPTLDLAAHYHTSRWAGGDYYDLFRLPGGLWGILIADVSGHGTPAAVMMAITHALAHTYSGDPIPPGLMLEFVNHHLSTRYTVESEAFVTAFYGIYDPSRRTLNYACAGHNPPRLKRCQDGTVASLDGVSGLPLGINPDESYEQAVQELIPGDQIIFYTDGVTEAVNPAGQMFGLERLDEVLENCSLTASGLLHAVVDELERFCDGRPASDDQTLLVAKVS